MAKDDVEAVKWFRQAAERNEAGGLANLADCYFTGRGVAKNEAEGVKWLRQAAMQNYAGAQVNLGGCYLNGRGVAKDEAEAVKWFRKAAEQNAADAQNNLGYCYAHGLGVTKNEVEAVKWYRKAAEQGDLEAQLSLGQCYNIGEGVPTDPVEAITWWLLAAAQGSKVAKQNLAISERSLTREQMIEAQKRARDFKLRDVLSLQTQLGNAQSDPLAELRGKAEAGDVQSQRELGQAFYDGNRGIAKDYMEAYRWWLIAAAQDGEQGRKARIKFELMELEGLLSREQMAEAKQQAAVWIEQHKKAVVGGR